MKVTMSGATFTNQLRLAGFSGGSNIANPSPGTWNGFGNGSIADASWSVALDQIQVSSNTAWDGVIDIWWCGGAAAGAVHQTPNIQVTITNLPSPTFNTYTTIPDLGAAIDELEHKLDFMRDLLVWLTTRTAPPIAPPGDTSISNLLTIVQRQLVPFAYIHSTVHAGLSGAGSFTVADLVGVMVVVTAYPAGNRTIAGEPTYIYDLGWLSIETIDGFIDEHRLTSTAQVWLPRSMSTATKVGYSLRSGVTATLTELRPEP